MKTSQFLCFGLFLVLIGPGEVIAGGGEGSACTTLPPGHAYPFSDDCKRVSSTSTCTSTDADGDGIYDVRCGGPGLEQLICDNCPDASNPTQADSDCDGIGDPCEMQCSGAREGKSEACSGLKDPPGSCHVCEKSPSGDFSYGRCDTAFCTPPPKEDPVCEEGFNRTRVINLTTAFDSWICTQCAKNKEGELEETIVPCPPPDENCETAPKETSGKESSIPSIIRPGSSRIDTTEFIGDLLGGGAPNCKNGDRRSCVISSTSGAGCQACVMENWGSCNNVITCDPAPKQVDECTKDPCEGLKLNERLIAMWTEGGRAEELDKDADGDGIPNRCDMCPKETDPGKESPDKTTTYDYDVNGDGVKEACNPPRVTNSCKDGGKEDQDKDGLDDDCDICPKVPNPGQEDNRDNDGVGDACDNCPGTPNSDQADDDHDGTGNICDDDHDDFCPTCCTCCCESGNCSASDPCLDPEGVNSDSDHLNDMCDNCPLVKNSGQHDTDGDEVGNVCDNCPEIFNIDQADADGDTVGDACEAQESGDPTITDPICGENGTFVPMTRQEELAMKLSANDYLRILEGLEVHHPVTGDLIVLDPERNIRGLCKLAKAKIGFVGGGDCGCDLTGNPSLTRAQGIAFALLGLLFAAPVLLYRKNR